MPKPKKPRLVTPRQYLLMPVEERVEFHARVPLKKWFESIKKPALGKEEFTVREAVKLLGKSSVNIKTKIRAGKIKAVKRKRLGRTYNIIPLEEMQRLLLEKETRIPLAEAHQLFLRALKGFDYKIDKSNFYRLLERKGLLEAKTGKHHRINFIELAKLIDRVKSIKRDHVPAREAYAVLGLTRTVFDLGIKKGRIKVTRFGNSTFVPKREVERLKEIKENVFNMSEAFEWLEQRDFSIGVSALRSALNMGVIKETKTLHDERGVSKQDLADYLDRKTLLSKRLTEAVAGISKKDKYYARLIKMDPDILRRKILLFHRFGEFDLSKKSYSLAKHWMSRIKADLAKATLIEEKKALDKAKKMELLTSVNITPKNPTYAKLMQKTSRQKLEATINFLAKFGVTDLRHVASKLFLSPTAIKKEIETIKRTVTRRSKIPRLIELYVQGLSKQAIAAKLGHSSMFVRTTMAKQPPSLRLERALNLIDKGHSIQKAAIWSHLPKEKIRARLLLISEIKDVMKFFPHLSRKETNRLIMQVKKGDKLAVQEMFLHNLGLLLKEATRASRLYGMAKEELMGGGAEGLFQAIHRFDPGKGFAFSTLATCCIRGAISNAIRSYRPKGLREVKAALSKAMGKRRPSIAEVSQTTGVSERQVERVLSFMKGEKRLESEVAEGLKLIEVLESRREARPFEAVEKKIAREEIFGLLQDELKHVKGTKRDKQIFLERAGINGRKTLAEVGKEFGDLTHQRIGKIYAKIKKELLERPKIKRLLEEME